MAATVKSGELYRHYKGDLYRVVVLACHSETGEPMVVYESHPGGTKAWVRPLEMFCSDVAVAGAVLKRFLKVELDTGPARDLPKTT